MTQARAASARRRQRKAAKRTADDGLSLKSLGGSAILFTTFTLASIFFILPIGSLRGTQVGLAAMGCVFTFVGGGLLLSRPA